MFYNDIQDLFGQYDSPIGISDNRFVPNGLFSSVLANKVIQRSIEIANISYD
jgi:hypothetical protein